MSGRCQFVTGAQSSLTLAVGEDGEVSVREPEYSRCDAPASIRRNGVWLCADHYDEVERNAI